MGRHFIRSSAVLFLCLSAGLAGAQSTTSLLPDATVLPSRTLRFRVLVSFTRFDEYLGTPDSPRNIASSLNADSLGPAQLPILSPSETAIRAASGITNFHLTTGKLAAAANSRVVTAPLIIEYGLSSRLTLGVVVPLVETRTSLAVQYNQSPGFANVGPNPALTNPSILSQNNALVQSMISAAATLSGRLGQCQAAPTGSGCDVLLAQQGSVQSLVQSSTALAKAIGQLYGTSATTPGQLFIPLASDPTQLAIAFNLAIDREQFRNYFNGVDVITGSISGANGPAARNQLQSLLTSLGHDTLRSPDRSSIGDITVGASYQLVNTFPVTGDSTTSVGRRYRVAVNGAYRIGTGEPADRNRFFDNATGFGQPGVLAGLAGDIELSRRWSASAVGSYTLQLGSVNANRIPNALDAALPLDLPTYTGTYSAGNVLSLSLIPRFRLSRYFGLTGTYSLVNVGADKYTATQATFGGSPNPAADFVFTPPVNPGMPSTTAQQVGFGFSYSTLISGDRGPGRIPFEVNFSHLETIAASGGPTPKTFRDQVELKVYFVR